MLAIGTVCSVGGGLLMAVVAGCRWLFVVQPARFCTALSCQGPAAFLLEHSCHVTTVHASRRPGAARHPPDDACSTHSQIQAWVSCSPLRVAAALRPIA